MAGKSENILVEFDYNNISIIDPNKVIDSSGNVKERYIKQEDLVMYANLDCKVLPRSKVAIGGAIDDSARTIRLATINFLNPGNKTFLDNRYTDEITGKNTLRGEGVNQFQKRAVRNPNKSDDFYITQQIKSNGKLGSVDNGMLGIVSISIKQNSSFLTSITMQLEDIKGRTLFESGDESPYAAFFNLPYPVFTLTIKGFIGKAMRIDLMLTKFNARYDASSGNFKIQLDFMTYKYTILSEISMGALLAVPHMYKNTLKLPQTSGGASPNTQIDEVVVEKGFEKIKELYSEYKEKGLIPENFPELTLVELKDRIEVFIKTTLENFTKQNLDPLTDVKDYGDNLDKYRGEIFYYSPQSWFNKYMDQVNFYVVDKDNNKFKIYTFKEEFKEKKNEIITELKGYIEKYNKILGENKTLGVNGSYTIDGTTKESKIPINIQFENFYINVTPSDIDKDETLRQRKNIKQPNTADKNSLAATLDLSNVFNSARLKLKDGTTITEIPYFIFEGPGSFIDTTDNMFKFLKKFKEQIENELTDALAKILQSPTNGFGFSPTIRNILAVIFANGEAFLRLMDDVHTAAYKLENNEIRRQVILDPNKIGVSSNVPAGPITDQTPIYPWPQIINITNVEGKEKYEIKYPGDKELKDITKAYRFDIWPEVEFVEEFIKGYVQRDNLPSNPTPLENSENEPSRISYNSIEFPIKNNIYSNKEQTKFLFEIYERAILNTYYSKLSRSSTNTSVAQLVTTAVGECESTNIKIGLGNDSPFLLQTLKNVNIDATNILNILQNFSNDGLGESWQNYIRGIFSTRYIRNLVDNADFQFLDIELFKKTNSQPLISLEKEKNIKDFVVSTTSNVFDVTDTFPFTNLLWCKNNLEEGENVTNVLNLMDTSKTLLYNDTFKIITNFNTTTEINKNKPFTYFLTENQQQPNVTDANIRDFYKNRVYKFDEQLLTEGSVFYGAEYKGAISNEQTTSIFNTPYFVNAIQYGVDRYFNNSPYPYTAAAYLFLNSLPLATLKEKLKSLNGTSEEKTTYLFSSLKKFSAIHKLPYAWILKYGSIWHRYKSYIEGGSTPNADILTPIWKDFDAKENFDPISGNPTTTYNLRINNQDISVVMESGLTITNTGSVVTDEVTIMNVGFYPKLINDFSVFYVGTDIIARNSQIIGVGGINGNTLTITQLNGTLFSGDEILGNNIIPGTTIVSIINSTTFFVQPAQQAITDTFFVTNNSNPGYTDNDIQNAFFSGLTMISRGVINFPKLSDTSNQLRSFSITPWTVYLQTLDKKFSYLIPSVGSLVEQFRHECFDTSGNLKFEVTGNTSLYNGTIRTYWSAPNYGYFSSDAIKKPTPFEYVKFIDGKSKTENFSLNNLSFYYSEIDELLSVFDKEVLDKFEQEFLNFSKSIYDFKDDNTNSGTQTSVANFKNFQALMREYMKVPTQVGLTSETTINNMQTKQFELFSSNLKQFLNYDVIVKIGNPSNFDKRLFYTFSNIQIENPYTWREYSVYTPLALPSTSLNTTLATSQNLYPASWVALYTYVGFSLIPELKYKDDGSFITDFFIDFNIEFTPENIKTFAPIIKIYATQKLIKFQENSIPPPPLPNNSVEQLLATYTLSNFDVLRIYQIFNQKFARISSPTNLVIFTSTQFEYTESNNFILNTVLTQVYSSSPVFPIITTTSETTTPQFPNTPSPLNPNGSEALKNSMNLFLQQSENYLDDVINNIFLTLRKDLKNVSEIVPDQVKISPLEGPQTKDELWEVFKAINDKWIAGSNISQKTLFEDILILDRANRNIGEKFLVDIFALKNRLANIPEKSNMLLYVQSLLRENHFQVLNIPGYVNFYNVQEVVKDPVPKPEGTLEIGNTLFGVFNNVDYTNSSTKMVCIYAGKPSEHLAIKNVDYRFRNDAFELTRFSDNPLIENQIGKNDWDKSNKVVGFNVDIGTQNQSIIKSFSVSQNGGLATMESLKILNQMASQAGNKSSSTQSVSLYNLYKNRSYTCNLSMMGNVMIQPTMYFNLRYVPMFTGPYYITEVNHTIGIGDFTTDVVGVRQPTASLPTVDNFLQSLKQNLLRSIIDKQKQAKDGKKVDAAGNVIDQKEEVVNTAGGELKATKNQNCKPTISKYEKYVSITPETYKKSFVEIKSDIENIIQINNFIDIDDKLKYVIFAAMYLGSGYDKGFEAFEHNYSGVILLENWQSIGESTFGRRPQYFCLIDSSEKERPYAVFTSSNDHIRLLVNKWKNKMLDYTKDVDSFTKFIILNKGVYNTRNLNVYQTMTPQDISNIKSKVEESMKIYDAS